MVDCASHLKAGGGWSGWERKAHRSHMTTVSRDSSRLVR